MSEGTDTQAFGELYSAYAAGCLDPAFALLVETQSALRADVRRQVRQGEIIAAVLLETEMPARLSAGAVDRALSAIDGFDPREDQVRQAADLAGSALNEMLALPEPLRSHSLDAIALNGWKFNARGIRRLKLDVGSQAETELYRLEPGARVPRHSHEGCELTLVVAGGFTDETGSYGPGDVTVKGEHDTHQPIADPGEPCFALAVRDGGLRFTGMMGVVQRLLG